MVALKILILSFLVSREFTQTLGELALPMYRIVLIALFPYVVWILYRKARNIDWNVCDLFALMLSIWPSISFGLNTGWISAIESGGSLGLDLLIPYFLVRATVYDYNGRKQFAMLLCLLTGVLVLTGLPEAFTGTHYIHHFATLMTGQTFEFAPEIRYGIWRAMGPTDHPIIFGTICASTLAMATILSTRRPVYMIAVVAAGVGSVISASTAPILVALVQAGMLSWNWLFRARWKWLLLFSGVVFLYLLVDIASTRDPFRVMFTYLLLNPATGYARYEMWANAYAISTQTLPGLLVGYGYDSTIYEAADSIFIQTLMTKSVDSLWLTFLFRHGIIMVILLTLLLTCVFRRVLKLAFSLDTRRDRRLMMGYFISAFAMTLISLTVHYWSLAASLYMMILAVCIGKMAHRKNEPRASGPDHSNS